MTTGSQTDNIASKYLGKRTEGSFEYDPSLLVAVPREENRVQYGINSDELPFIGYDVWHCYEFSSLTEKGLPVTRVLKLKYSCDSPYIVESKSLKLYLNSFNMTHFGANIEECLNSCCNLIETDLSNLLKSQVRAYFLSPSVDSVSIFDNYADIISLSDKDVKFENFKETPSLLRIKEGVSITEYFLKFDSLRSNCRVTHQPDFGDVYIYYKSKKIIEYTSLVEYLVSFRSEYHFHEECCEMIFKRLYDLLDEGDELMVAALYTRRGGIDISPVRYTKSFRSEDVDKILDLSKFARCGIKQ